MRTEKNTPSNCKFPACHYNQLPPPENSQECVACEGNTDPKWEPNWPGRLLQHVRISPAHPRVHLAVEAITEENKADSRATWCGIGLRQDAQLHLSEPVTCELCLRKLRARERNRHD